jgi:hypothetical protein
MLVDNVAVAKKALQAIGYPYTEEQVLGMKLPNRPGYARNSREAARRRWRQHRLHLPWRGIQIIAAACRALGVRLGPRKAADQVSTAAQRGMPNARAGRLP